MPATEVAAPGTASPSLLKIYAHCIDGQADAANKRIADALGGTDDSPDNHGQDDQGHPDTRAGAPRTVGLAPCRRPGMSGPLALSAHVTRGDGEGEAGPTFGVCPAPLAQAARREAEHRRQGPGDSA